MKPQTHAVSSILGLSTQRTYKMSKQLTTESATLSAPITDIQQIVENGESPTAIILAITILISVIMGSTTKLVQSILLFQNKAASHDKDTQ